MNPKEDHYSTQPQVSITTNKINNCLISPKPSLCLHLSHCTEYLLKFLVQSKMKNSYILLDYYFFWVSFHRSSLYHHPYFISLRQRGQVTCLLECPTSGFNWFRRLLMNLLLCLVSPFPNLCVRIPVGIFLAWILGSRGSVLPTAFHEGHVMPGATYVTTHVKIHLYLRSWQW